MSNRNTYILVPARLDSSRIHNKLIKKFSDGSCVISRVMKRLKTLDYIPYLVTDSEDIIKASGHDDNLCFIEQSGNSGTDRLSRFLTNSSSVQMNDEDCCIIVLGDQPEINLNLVRLAKQYYFQKDNKFDAVTFHTTHTDYENYVSPNNCKLVLGDDNRIFYISRSPIPGHVEGFSSENNSHQHLQHISIVAISAKWLRNYHALPKYSDTEQETNEWLRFILNGCLIQSYETSELHEPDVNVQSDWEYYEKKYGN